MIKSIKMVMFDMAGTTVKDNDEVLDCFEKACKISGLKAERKRLNALMGWSKVEVFRLLWLEELGESSAERIERQARKSYKIFKQILEDYYSENPVTPTEGCLETFDFLKGKGIKIALNTGFYRTVTDILLKQLNWKVGEMIDFSIASDEVLRGRPEPYMIRAAMDNFNIRDVRKVIKIGDTPVDLQEGRAVGCWNFGLTNGTHTRTELEIYENDGLFESLFEFTAFLKEEKEVAV
jgi:phosphonatase-like hydrolase